MVTKPNYGKIQPANRYDWQIPVLSSGLWIPDLFTLNNLIIPDGKS